MATDASKSGAMRKDLIVYLSLLILAAIQFVIAYQQISPSQMFARMLVIAIIEASLALLFFMHLSENRALLWFVAIFNVFVILAMQFGWTDSFRILDGVPWSK
jgi:caa(3)-type oxidase subunit IV